MRSILRLAPFPALALALSPAGTGAAAPPDPALVRVRIETSAGAIVVAVDTRRAPLTAANFLTYVDDGRFDGTTFYRAARRKAAPKLGFIQGGIDTDARRALPPIPLERTSRTGIRHADATLSMARGTNADSGMGNFFMTVGAVPSMDAQGPYPGYAAFGHVVAGMDTVRRILAEPTAGGSGAMKGQIIVRPVRLIAARRIDGRAHPSGQPKPWLLRLGR